MPTDLDEAHRDLVSVAGTEWRLLYGQEPDGWWATGSRPVGRALDIVSTSRDGTMYPDLALALQALAAKLREKSGD